MPHPYGYPPGGWPPPQGYWPPPPPPQPQNVYAPPPPVIPPRPAGYPNAGYPNAGYPQYPQNPQNQWPPPQPGWNPNGYGRPLSAHGNRYQQPPQPQPEPPEQVHPTQHRSKRWPTLNAVIAADATRTRFKITNKPSQEILASTFYTFRHVTVHATPTHYMRLFSQQFPWSIEIPSQQQDITCEMVWSAIYGALQEPLEDSEWGMLCAGGEEGGKKMDAIFKARQKRLELNSMADKRLLRCDFLGENVWFLGLEKDEEYEKRRLLPSSKHAQMPAPDNTWLVSMGK